MSVSEGMMMSPSDVTTAATTTERRVGMNEKEEVESAKCDCCGLTEECTPEYINKIRERYEGKWICGLCEEAVNYEKRSMSTEEALNQHMDFYNHYYNSSLSPPINSALHLISAVRNILRRSLDAPTSMPTTPITPRRPAFSRSDSCIPTLSSTPISSDYHHHLHDDDDASSFSFSSSNTSLHTSGCE